MGSRYEYEFKAERDALFNAIARCHNPRNPAYRNYGARGIQVADIYRVRGSGFAAFLKEVGPRPSPHHCIDRIDNNGHYAPGNLRWVDRATNQQNRRQIKEQARDLGWGMERKVCRNGKPKMLAVIEYQGRRQHLEDWAAELGLKGHTLLQRFDRGWPLDKVMSPFLFTPSGKPRQR